MNVGKADRIHLFSMERKNKRKVTDHKTTKIPKVYGFTATTRKFATNERIFSFHSPRSTMFFYLVHLCIGRQINRIWFGFTGIADRAGKIHLFSGSGEKRNMSRVVYEAVMGRG